MSGGFCPFGHVPISSPTDPRKLRGDRNGIPKRPELITDKALRAWLRAGPVDRGIGDGLTFVASAHGAAACKASWVLRFRFGGAAKEKVLGRYPDLSLAQAREKARSDRALIQQDIDVAAGKRLAQLDARRTHSVKTAPRPTSAAPNTPLVVQAIDPQRATVCRLVQAWLDRYIPPPPATSTRTASKRYWSGTSTPRWAPPAPATSCRWTWIACWWPPWRAGHPPWPMTCCAIWCACSNTRWCWAGPPGIRPPALACAMPAAGSEPAPAGCPCMS
ncbi:DUF4102 domain-containing protein [Stenotrophomonas maltophilia]|nr:DUF4102 domain-containing protein [Stenotrophomonas maltophilia]